ncbi:pre-rRNA processing [Diatrype stigma]|uniref:Pre-rRNA processing n=1 Tax=Diatrype stigma TaxID=117547 RepID=A0AAN9V0Y6_9PEZI
MAGLDDASSLAVQNEEQLWNELHRTVTTQCSFDAHETIDDALRVWLDVASRFRSESPYSEDAVAYCSQRLLAGSLFRTNPDYVRIQIIYSLLQEDEPAPLYVIASLLVLDGRTNEATFRSMIDESCFVRLLELINGRKTEDPSLHRLLLELMYEMSRIERLRYDDLLHVDDDFVTYLFQLIEEMSDDVHDPYHYPIIRVLLMLNEQYMIASTNATNDPDSPSAPLTNRVVKCLSLYGPQYRTFGENLILVLNRETETSLQLLILKLLYLLFTTKATYEYFYTNDLRVLLDVIIRNLLDLPNELMSLRHTYLRVMYPLLAHTQLSQPPYYKKDEIQKVLSLLAPTGNAHFAPADDTTLRLVDRVSKVPWLCDPPEEEGSGASEVARKLLGISLGSKASASNTSVVDLVAVQEKPGIQTPSRHGLASAFNVAGDVAGGIGGSVPDNIGSVGRSFSGSVSGSEHRHHHHHHHHHRHRRSSKHDLDHRHHDAKGNGEHHHHHHHRPNSRARSLSISSTASSKFGSPPATSSPLRESSNISSSSLSKTNSSLLRDGSTTDWDRDSICSSSSRTTTATAAGGGGSVSSIGTNGGGGGGGAISSTKSSSVGSSRSKKPLPEVPRHKHGIPFKVMESNLSASSIKSAPSINSTSAVAAATTTPAAAVAAAAATKKLPPKAPPPRRKGRLKATAHTSPPTEIITKNISELVP